jgi:Cysteine rich repeat
MTRLDSARTRLLAMIIALAALVFWIGTSVYAEISPPCAEEIAKFCKDIQPCKGLLMDCLKEHENELSSTCKAKVEEVNKRFEKAQQACAEDIQKFCKDIQPGGGRIAKCLKEHACDLSSACKEKCAANEEIRGQKKSGEQTK